jgi:enoyl-CoA hydratase
MDYKTLIIDTKAQNIAIVRLSRPEAANALNTAMGKELASAFAYFSKKSSKIRAVILTGEGRHFCAGADLKERKGMTKAAWQAQHAAFEKGLKALLACPVPIIAAVNGAAMGGGLELALVCDFIYASQTAKFALPETTLGIMPGLGGTQNLPRAIGTRRAKEYLFTGKPFSAETAAQLGLINRLCAPEMLLQETIHTAETIAKAAPLSIRGIKKAVTGGIAQPLAQALQHEKQQYNLLLGTRDRREGIDAFNQKRTPTFTGE